MRRRRIALLAALALATPALATASPATVPQAAKRVGSAIPAIEAYRADHGTYAGLTVARIRAYDSSIRGVAIKRAGRNAYCVQSTLAGPLVHYDGPAGPLRHGRCGVRGAVVPRTSPSLPPAQGDTATAQSRVRAAIPAIEAYAADNVGYAGLTLEKIRAWDRGVAGITVAWSTRAVYCIQSTVGSATYHLHGPAHPVASGRCPAAP